MTIPEPTKSPQTTIRRGIGKLTPELWDELMWVKDWLHENSAALDSIIKNSGYKKGVQRNFFFAKLTKAKVVADNKYKYAWTRVTLNTSDYSWSDSSYTSTVDSDDFARAAYNTMETANTSTKTSPGVDEDGSDFPATLKLQAIGGGQDDDVGDSVTLALNPIVIIFIHRDSDYSAKYFFCASNSYDGTCG
jgi:hypothetical protein